MRRENRYWLGMEMAGITRIKIVSNWDDWRKEMEEGLAPPANELYRQIFNDIGMPLEEGEEVITCTLGEAKSRYDWQEGIDVILKFLLGGKATMQEKFLTFHDSTATFEERKSSGEEGVWYYCTAQYYFVGYARTWKTYKEKLFQDWMLIDFPAIKRADGQDRVHWHENGNRHDGRRATFRYVYFDEVPSDCIIARMPQVVQLAF